MSVASQLPPGADGIGLCLEELTPYRRLAGQLTLKPRSGNLGHQAGHHVARAKGRGMEFDEVRQYQVGDDVRTIDWRVTARSGKPHTKLFQEERERPVLLLTDLGASMQFGTRLLFKAVQAAHLSALLAWHVAERGDRIGALIGDGRQLRELKPKARQQGVLAILHGLVEMQNQAPALADGLASPLNDLLRRALKQAPPGSQLWVLSDFSGWSDESQWLLSRLHKHAEVACFMVTDPLELALPQSRLPLSLPVTSSQGDGLLSIGNPRFRQQYQQANTKAMAALRDTLRSLDIRFASLGAHHALEAQLDKLHLC
ncbi:DUF58 domain-containing protein [Gallaecimonas sp. GXIMD4217]|uniref:DUF58 domain-containing protein n=1 Tax=Gallaecimonas sp. GXIMD4217 TaxID=3131927 RepID=UPI00311AD3AB